MTRVLSGEEVARKISEAVEGSVVRWDETNVWVETDSVADVASFLKDAPELEFSFLTSVTSVDYIEYFELIYRLLSMKRNHSVVIRTRCYGRDEVSAPSVTGVWRGAEFQEREIWDLMGIRFEGHPNMKRILLWEGFSGHPLRKDYLDQQVNTP